MPFCAAYVCNVAACGAAQGVHREAREFLLFVLQGARGEAQAERKGCGGACLFGAFDRGRPPVSGARAAAAGLGCAHGACGVGWSGERSAKNERGPSRPAPSLYIHMNR